MWTRVRYDKMLTPELSLLNSNLRVRAVLDDRKHVIPQQPRRAGPMSKMRLSPLLRLLIVWTIFFCIPMGIHWDAKEFSLFGITEICNL
jgi:hypothetical protein